MTPPHMLSNALKLFGNSCFGWGHVSRPTVTPFNWLIVFLKQSIRAFPRGVIVGCNFTPLGRIGYVFGLFPMPTFIRLDHSLHNVMIDLHIALACVILGLIIVHVSTGLQILPEIGRSPCTTMLWPWRNKQ